MECHQLLDNTIVALTQFHYCVASLVYFFRKLVSFPRLETLAWPSDLHHAFIIIPHGMLDDETSCRLQWGILQVLTQCSKSWTNVLLGVHFSSIVANEPCKSGKNYKMVHHLLYAQLCNELCIAYHHCLSTSNATQMGQRH